MKYSRNPIKWPPSGEWEEAAFKWLVYFEYSYHRVNCLVKMKSRKANEIKVYLNVFIRRPFPFRTVICYRLSGQPLHYNLGGRLIREKTIGKPLACEQDLMRCNRSKVPKVSQRAKRACGGLHEDIVVPRIWGVRPRTQHSDW